jgi:cysteine-rich repeat protein
VTPGETITLEFHIWDTQDGSEDSLVLLDNFYWLIDSTTVGTQVLTQECGDGIIHDELGETCDTGGESATCDDDCTAVACGDGNHNAAAGEACDDGTNSNNDACLDASGSNCIVAICGDGYINSAAETCDDSNTTAGDGCTSTCQTQTGYTCTGTPSTCIETPVCGDGVTAGDETCDDGGDSATCDSDCTTPSCGDGYRNPMTGELCDDGNDAVNDACPDGSLGTCLSAACGDGYFYEGQETCEDENNIAGDGCSSLCVIESGYTCTGLPSVCIATCGDGVAAGTEACDDSGDSESCNANCTTSSCGDGYSNAAAGEACDDGNQSLTDACPDGVTFGCQQARCGDGYIYADAEACDDGNALPADGCSESCVVESGFTCTGALSNCITTCGDGIAAGAEPCDDAADSADCNIDCTPATCGDGYVNAAASEVCDDGNNELNDGCPDGPGGTCTLASCGDGIIFFGPEVCDDGNTANYDGCTSGCVPEPGYTCTGEPSLCSAECGDGVVAAGELCDEFFETANCDANCTPVECGDGTLNTIAGETCDDGNAEIHDACPDGPTASCLAATCGDAIIWAGQEICDDGNGFSLDGCSNVCGVENGFVCTGEPSTCWTICGDGIAAGPETCDDGNTTALDGCSDTCALEPGYECEGAPSACNTVCGDSIIVGLEQCDDGGQSATCDLDCSTAVCGDGYRNIDAGELCDDGNSILNDICPDGPNGTCISASCGDGLIQDGSEACDDGGVISSDGCSYQCGIEPGYLCAGEPSTCWTVCGDGIRAGDELCDDGNDNDGDSCLSDCGAPFCGDGNVLNFMEVCDDGNEDLHDGCPDGPLGTCMPAACGDGYIWAGTEGCDDGDATAGDGCSDTCAIETGYTCVSEPSLCTTHCGDGLIAGPEGCDDQGESAACNADCSIATCGDGYINTLAGETCDDGDHNLSDGCPDGPDGSCQTAVCGDGYRSTGSEACDDGNALSGDGCSVACELEIGFVCYGRPSQCMTVCGDGITAGSEECDTTGTSPGCNSNCTLTVCGDGYRNAQAGESCDDGNQDLTDSCPDGDFGNCQTATCGDGYIFGALEVCDDGNVDDDDGCSSTCLVELGYQCLGRPSQCDTICGDGIIAGTEICDHEGGSATCTPSCNPSYCGDEYVNLQAGESCDDGNGVLTDACPDGPLGTCQSAWCGDGYLWAAEELCEDRNELIGDGCSDLCEVEPGWICDDATLLCATVCGDGLIRAAELCDDGGLVNEDGCNITCEVEEGWTCSDEPSLCVEDTAPDTSNGPGDTGEPEDSSSPGSSIPLGSPSDAAEMGGGSQSLGTGIVSELPDPTAPNNVTDPVDTETIAPPSAMADAGLELRGNGSDCSAQGLPPLYWVLALSLMLLRRRRRHEQRR